MLDAGNVLSTGRRCTLPEPMLAYYLMNTLGGGVRGGGWGVGVGGGGWGGGGGGVGGGGGGGIFGEIGN